MEKKQDNNGGLLFRSLVGILNGLQSLVGNNDVEAKEHYTTIRHSLPVVYYRGPDTEVSMSVFGDKPYDVEHRKVYLQKRGWLSGIVGVPEAADAGWDVTPAKAVKEPPSRTEKRLESFEKRREEYGVSTHKPLETMVVRIPPSTGDGYFRLRVVSKGKNIVNSRSFRVISAGFHSAVLRGASIVTLPFEFLFATLQLTLLTAAYTALFAAFPFLKLAQAFPGKWQTRTLDRMWRWANGQQHTDEILKKYNVKDKFEQAKTSVSSIDSRIPWAMAGVRRDFDEDDDMPKGTYYRFK